MNALFLWIVLPIVAASALYFFRRWINAVQVAGVFIAFTLAWLAWQLPTGESSAIRLWAGLPPLKVTESLTILGQRFVLSGNSRPVILLIYLGVGFWLVGAFLVGVDRSFVPLCLVVSALQVAALSAESGLSIPVCLELIALSVALLLSPPGTQIKRGALRFIIYQTMGACLILFSERWWLLSTTSATNIEGFPIPLLIMCVGYACLLAVPPFHTWFPKSAEEIDPYIAAFIFYTLPVGTAFLLLKNLDRFVLWGAPSALFSGLISAGALMALVGGLGAAFERRMDRILGFTALNQTGVLLLSLGLSDPTIRDSAGIGIMFSQLVPMGTGLAVWAMALRFISLRSTDLRLDSVRGFARLSPIPSISLILAQFSLSGYPLLGSFPIYTGIWTALGSQSSKSALAFTIGIAFLFLASIRTLASLVSPGSGSSHRITEGKMLIILLFMGVTILLIAGLAPQWLDTWLTRLGVEFIGLNP